jgi:hypothetical protein
MNLAPILSSATPADDTSAVAVGSNIVLTFNENVLFGSGTITISDGYTQSYLDKSGTLQTRWVGATDTRVLSINDPQVSISGNVVTIDLSQDLKAGLTYNVTMSKGFLQDSNSMPFAGILGSGKLNFTTAGGVTAPTAHIGATIQFNDTGTSHTDYITNSASVQGTYSGTLGAHDMVQVSLDNGATWNIASAANGSWSYNGSPGLEGASTVIARVSNTIGQSSGSTSHSYVFDDVGASAVSASLDHNVLGLGGSATVTITFSEAVSGFTINNSTINSATYGAFSSSDGGLTWTATVTPNAETSNSAVHDSLVVSATDVAGNPLHDSLINIDTYAVQTISLPSVTLAITGLSSDTGSSATDFITSSASQHISGTISAPVTGNATVQVSLDGGSTWYSTTVDNNNLTWTTTNALTLLSGHNSMMVRVSDGTNNGTPVEHGYTVDTQAPTLQSSTLSASSIVLTFDEDINVDTHTFFTLTDSNGTPTQIGVENSLVSVNGHSVTLTLPNALSNNTHYSLDMEGGSVTDLAGNVVYSNTDHLMDLATDGSGNLQMASHIIASATSAFNATSTSISGQYYSVNGTDHVQVYDGSSWNTVSDAAVSGNIRSWTGSINLLSNAVQVRLVDASGNAVQYLNEGASTLYFGASDALTVAAPNSNSIVFGGANNSIITTAITVGDHAHLTSGAGQNSIVAGDYADIISNGRDGIVVGSHATVVMNGSSGSTLASAGSYLNLTTEDGGHSIVLSGLDANSSITANGSNDTLNFNFSATTSLHDLVNTYHMTGVEILNLMLASNDITIGDAADVEAFAGGHDLYIAGSLATTVHIDPTQWDLTSTSGSYTKYIGHNDQSIHLFVWTGMGLTQ